MYPYLRNLEDIDVKFVHIGDGDEINHDIAILFGLISCVGPIVLTFILQNKIDIKSM